MPIVLEIGDEDKNIPKQNPVCNYIKLALEFCRKLYNKYILQKKDENIIKLENLILELNKLNKNFLLCEKEYTKINEERQKQKLKEEKEYLKEEKLRQLDLKRIREEFNLLDSTKNKLKESIFTLNKNLQSTQEEFNNIILKQNKIDKEVNDKLEFEEEFNRLNKENDKIEAENLRLESIRRENSKQQYLECRERILKEINHLKSII